LYSFSVLPLDCQQEFEPAREEDFFAALPERPAVFAVSMREPDAQPFLGRTANLRRRLERLLRAPAEPTRRLNLREVAARVRYRLTGSRFEQAFVLYQHARAIHPRRYRDFLRLRPPALLKLNLRHEYPRCYVTRRLLSDDALYVGPFPSRQSAQELANEFLNLYKIRRCQIKIRRDPSFPGCIYSEMKMCLAPCFAGCTRGEYDAEVARVRGFMSTQGGSLVAALEAEREAASAAEEFERAAAAHKRREKVTSILRGWPELARPVGALDAVVAQPAAETNTVAVFCVRGGLIAEPFRLPFAEMQAQPRSLEQILRERLESLLASDCNPPPATYQLSDHLSLLSRWYYSKPRGGEIFFPQESRSAARRGQREWPYRRMIRACSRVLQPPAEPEPPAGQPAGG
jgi:excinuclease UvrABC nuclease subunit